MKEVVVSNWGLNPTIYKERFCNDIVHFCAKGKSLTAFAAFIGISSSTLELWKRRHPDFKLACVAALEAQLSYWEEIAMEQATGANRGSAATLIFTLKNRFPHLYRDKQEVTMAGELNFIISTGVPPKLTEEEREAIEVDSREVDDGGLL